MASLLTGLLALRSDAKASSAVVDASKVAAKKDQDASLFSIVMGGCIPSKSKNKTPTPEPRLESRDRSPEPRETSAASDTNDYDDTASRTENVSADSQDSSQSDQQRPEDVAAPVELADTAAADVTDGTREGDIVDVPEGYGDELVQDLTKDPLTEAIALGLLVGQAVPVNQPPLAAGSSAVAADVVPAAAVNAPALPSIAQQPANPQIPPSIDLAADVTPFADLLPMVDHALPLTTPQVTLGAEATISAVQTPGIAVTNPTAPAVKVDTGSIVIPLDLAIAPEELVDDALVKAAATAIADAAAVQTASETAPLHQARIDLPAPAASAAASTPEAAAVLQTVAKDEKFKTQPALLDGAEADVVSSADALAEQAPKRLGKVAPAALKALSAQPDASPERMAALPEDKNLTRAAAAQISLAPTALRQDTVVTSKASASVEGLDGITQSSAGRSDGASGSNGLSGNFAATLQGAVQTPASQAAAQANPAQQIAAHIASLPKNKGTQFTMQLTPDELGAVDVVMDFHKDGHVQLTIRADNKEALAALQRDVHGLEQSLQNLGLKTDTSSLQFSLRQDQSQQQAGQFGDAQHQGQQGHGQSSASRGARANAGEETIPLASVNYSIQRSDGRVDFQA